MKMCSVAGALVTSVCLGSIAGAQSFNVDIGKNVLYPAPTSAYGAGAQQVGVWNAWGGISPTALTSIDGTPTSVNAHVVLSAGPFASIESDLAGSSGDDERLMDDRLVAQTTFGSLLDVVISGLWNGSYEVSTYAFDNSGGLTRVKVLGSPDPDVTLGGGTFPGSQVQNVTFAKHGVTVANGVITIQIDTANLFPSSINGFQVRWIPPAPVSYCTAKLNSLGCTPAIASNGTPSASAVSGFTISCANVRNGKAGLLIHGTSGRAAIPFQGGTLCVASPLRRTPVTSSGGAPPPAVDCTGNWQIDFNAFVSGALGGSPSPALAQPGVVIVAQWWGRDPGFPPPANTSLSDGLEFVQGF